MVWYEYYNWKTNPFTVQPVPETFIIEDIRSKVQEAVYSGNIINLYGQTGTGKTSLLRSFLANMKGVFTPVYIDPLDLPNHAPNNVPLEKRQYEGFLVKLSRDALKSPLANVRRLLGQTVLENIKSTYKGKKLVLLIDEAKDITDPTIPSYFRSIMNTEANCAIIITSIEPVSNLKTFSDSLRDIRVSFLEMRTISFDEAKLMLSKRIEKAGGKGIAPFDDTTLKFLMGESSNTPALILKNADDALKYLSFNGKPDEVTIENIASALSESAPKISLLPKTGLKPETEFVRQPKELEQLPQPVKSPFDELTDTQKKIVLALKEGPRTSLQLSEILGIDRNNLFTDLNRLRFRRDVERMKNKGIKKPVVTMSNDDPAIFSLTAEWKTAMVKE